MRLIVFIFVAILSFTFSCQKEEIIMHNQLENTDSNEPCDCDKQKVETDDNTTLGTSSYEDFSGDNGDTPKKKRKRPTDSDDEDDFITDPNNDEDESRKKHRKQNN